MKTLQWVLLTASLGAFACGGPKGYVIRGEVTGFPDSTMFYLSSSNAEKNIDSARVIGGRFRMQGVLPEEPETVYLDARVDQRSVYTYLLMGNEQVEIKGDIADFPRRVKISGSKYNDQWEVYAAITRPYDLLRDSLVDVFRELSDEDRDGEKGSAIWRQIRPIDRKTDSLRKAYLFDHSDTYPALIDLGYKMYDFSKDTVQMLFERMSPELQASRYARPIRTYLASEFVSEGGRFLDFEAEDQNGRPVRLSELVGRDGKYTLLEFTSSGCGFCMQAAKEMRRMVETYSDSLLMVSFSVDKNREYWQETTESDSVCWTSLWSQKNAESGSISIPYKIRGFPTFFVIDPQGTIVQRWSGYGPGTFEEKIGHLRNK